MSWLRSLLSLGKQDEQDDMDEDARHEARQAKIEAEADRHLAKQRWADVNRVTDEFAAAVERALRGSNR